MDIRPIGVFDSGLGGLTVVKEMRNVLKGEDIVYFGDTGRVPYGGRSRETIIKYAKEDIAFLRQFNIKAVVAACGTVSTNALDVIADNYDIPVYGVVNAAAEAALKATKNGRIGIIGTYASIRSGAFERKLSELDSSVEIFSAACPLLVHLVENGRTARDDAVLRIVTEEYLKPVRDSGVDTLILGCTHYPIIAPVISDIMGDVTLIDTGAETAKKLAEYLAASDMRSDKACGSCKYFVSDSAEDFIRTASVFLCSDIEGAVEEISPDGLRGGDL